MRVLILGASGFIGRYLVRRLTETRDHQIAGTFRTQAPANDGNTWHRSELTDEPSLEATFANFRPDVVVHLAAIADVGACEREPARATAVNVAATAAIARLCEQSGVKLVFMSTEYVFDGRRGFYREGDTPGPTTHYGRTKYEAEQEVVRVAPGSSILRTSIVYGGPAPGRRNFVPWLVERLGSGHSYLGSTETLRTPVYVEHLVNGIASLVEGDHPGKHHIAGKDWVSMYHFATAVAQGFGLDTGLVVPSSTTNEGNLNDQPKSADMLGLDCAKTMQALGLEQPGLADGIAAMRADAPEI